MIKAIEPSARVDKLEHREATNANVRCKLGLRVKGLGAQIEKLLRV